MGTDRMTMTLLNRPIVTGSTIVPAWEDVLSGLEAAKEFYASAAWQRRNVRIWPGDPSQVWLGRYLENQLNALLSLQDRWDGYRARPVTSEAVDSAVRVAFVVADDQTLPPQIFPLNDGGVQLEWRVGGEELEIEVDGAGEIHVLATDGSAEALLDVELSTEGRAVLQTVRHLVERLSRRAMMGQGIVR
jgi:hypothetical protein